MIDNLLVPSMNDKIDFITVSETASTKVFEIRPNSE
jgi:hypothetical protein